jgi:serine protease AprX
MATSGRRTSAKSSRSRRNPADEDDASMDDQSVRMTAPLQLDDPEQRQRWQLEDPKNHNRGPYLVELNVQYMGGLPGAAKRFRELFEEVCKSVSEADGIDPPDEPARVGKSYYRCVLRVKEWRKLLAEDERNAAQEAKASEEPEERSSFRCIYRLWPDFPVKGHISRSVATVKADAAMRSFAASGEQITWAIIDSGVDASHPHFGENENEHVLKHRSVRHLHRCFAAVPQPGSKLGVPKRLGDPDIDMSPEVDRKTLVDEHSHYALTDDYGHGTHVAGIIAGSAPKDADIVVIESEDSIDEGMIEDDQHARVKVTRERIVSGKETKRFHGVATECRLISLRVLDKNGEGRSSDVIRALEYVRETLNDNPKMLRVHGVNLSVGYEFDAQMFACGQSPLCTEVNRLVQAGVVVVTAAGNTGYGSVNAQARSSRVGLSNTINDPGNAELAITVGATHREAPHTYGVSYFSSKGPTGDGRLKPDIVAPGERIISCAAGSKLVKAEQRMRVSKAAPQADGLPPGGVEASPRPTARYVEDTGTSMAAPHVSGAIAAFLSIRREFIGRPLDVKKIFLSSAIPLGREKYFEGHGLLDLMKAIQSV